MRLFVAFSLVLISITLAAAEEPQPPYVCASHPNIVASCFEVHGRLSFWNGAPSARIWPVGTKRLLGVHSDILPPALEQKPRGFETEWWADFTVCPFTPSQPGHMQFVCIESWRHLIIKQHPE